MFGFDAEVEAVFSLSIFTPGGGREEIIPIPINSCNVKRGNGGDSRAEI